MEYIRGVKMKNKRIAHQGRKEQNNEVLAN
jgi:hypothetical protein